MGDRPARQLREGKSSAFINDQPVSGGVAADRRCLIEIQGQFEGRGLLDVSITVCCSTGLPEPPAPESRQGLAAWQEAGELAVPATSWRARAEEDYLRDAVGQLDELIPRREGETLAANAPCWPMSIASPAL